MARVWEATTDPAWIEPIATAAAALGDTFKCNQAAVASGSLDLTYPSAEQLAGYMAEPDADVVVCYDDRTKRLDGYLVARRMASGALGQWVGVFQQAGQIAPIYRGLLDVPVAKHGWIRGRITNPELREWLRVNIPGTIDPDDPQVIQYGDVPT